jgi:hypothetical protein
MADPLEIIKDAVLTSVEFIHDYVQLRFDGPCLTINAPFEVLVGKNTYVNGSPGYRDALCDRIGRCVRLADTIREERVEIEFDDLAKLLISLRPADQATPEAAVLQDGSERVYIW